MTDRDPSLQNSSRDTGEYKAADVKIDGPSSDSAEMEKDSASGFRRTATYNEGDMQVLSTTQEGNGLKKSFTSRQIHVSPRFSFR